MKTRMKTLLSTLLLSGIVFFASCNKDDDNNSMRTYNLSGTAGGSQMVPSVSGSGTGNMAGTYDPNTHTMTYTTTWSGLTGAPTSGSFYYGASGTNGTAVGTPWTFAAGSTGTGSMSGTMTLTDAQAAQLTSGGWYYTYGTAANPSGEVRGQIAATR